jgi:hypothetical protein
MLAFGNEADWSRKPYLGHRGAGKANKDWQTTLLLSLETALIHRQNLLYIG